jgi:hypothetical protein
MDKSEELTKEFKSRVINNTVRTIQFFHINDSFTPSSKEKCHLIDGGIEIGLDNYSFGIRWNYDDEIYNWFENAAKNKFDKNDFNKVEITKFLDPNDFINFKIIEVDLLWEYFQNFDIDNKPVSKKHFIPLQIHLKFENNSQLLIALVNYKYDKTKGGAYGFTFNLLESEILISSESIGEIKNANK